MLRGDQEQLRSDTIQKRAELIFTTIPKTASTNAPVSLRLYPDTVDADFIQAKHHKDQDNDNDYSRKFSGVWLMSNDWLDVDEGSQLHPQ